MVAETIKRKKNTETVKKKQLKLVKENDTVEESDFDIKSIVDQNEAINKIKHYEEIKTGNKDNKRWVNLTINAEKY